MVRLQIKPVSPQRNQLFAGLFPAVSVLQKKTFSGRAETEPLRAAPAYVPIFCAVALEVKLQRKLHQAGITRPLHAAEVRSVRGVSIRLEELRMIERVEKLPAEVKLVSFSDRSALQEPKLPVVDAGSATNRSRRIADAS